MPYALALICLPPLLVFGVYHLLLWVHGMAVRRLVFWRRMALACAVSHVMLAGGVFLFFYIDYRSNGSIAGMNLRFDAFLFNRSPFWSLMMVFDTVPMLVLLALFGALDLFGMAFGAIVPLTVGIVLSVGTLQWYWVGGGIAAALDRLWSGLKGPEDEDEPRRWL